MSRFVLSRPYLYLRVFHVYLSVEWPSPRLHVGVLERRYPLYKSPRIPENVGRVSVHVGVWLRDWVCLLPVHACVRI